MAHEKRYPSRPHILAKRLELSRQRRAFGVRELVRKSGVDWPHLRRMLRAESTNPSAWSVARLAVALGVSVDYLLGVSEFNGAISPEAQSLGGRAGYLRVYD